MPQKPEEPGRPSNEELFARTGVDEQRGHQLPELSPDASSLARFVHEHALHGGFRAARGATPVAGQRVPLAPAGKAYFCCFDCVDDHEQVPTVLGDLREAESLLGQFRIEFEQWPPTPGEWSRWDQPRPRRP